MSATPEALQKGVVQGLFSSLEVMKDLKFAEICKYATLTDTAIYPFAVVMNLERWNALPPEVQQVMDDLRLEQAEWTGSYMDNHVQEALTWSRDTHQVEVITLSETEKADWNRPLQPITDAWVQTNGAKDFPAAAIVGDIQALIQQHTR
jgi:TRAP-type C4-dicarboxylate transport system substrate-binding protein